MPARPQITAPAVRSALSLEQKLDILTGAARYDASCSSSGSTRSGSGVGAAHRSGVCHSWSADGRCISLLKVLYSNRCRYDCAYCVNRRANDQRHASFTPAELARLTIDFYRRNYIEGLFLSSAVFASPDDTMQPLLETLRLLREEHRFHGYIHLKVIPGCSPELVAQAARLADRMSANIELPTVAGLRQLAPDKDQRQILRLFGNAASDSAAKPPARRGPRSQVNPAGMSTQMLVGATADSDLCLLQCAERLYRGPGLKRVYYSAYAPVNADHRLPATATAPPLLREHRLYQADWLLRFYRFGVDELLEPGHPQLDLALDPKAAWALRHLEHFPLDVNRASREQLLRIPGIGIRSMQRILRSRRQGRLRVEDLSRLGVVMKRARHFLHDGRFRLSDTPLREDRLRRALTTPGGQGQSQLSFDFSLHEAARSAASGEL